MLHYELELPSPHKTPRRNDGLMLYVSFNCTPKTTGSFGLVLVLGLSRSIEDHTLTCTHKPRKAEDEDERRFFAFHQEQKCQLDFAQAFKPCLRSYGVRRSR